jgi:deoxyribonucleoside regulator
MRQKIDKQMLYNVARMYYIEGLKQDEIATKINRSRSSISMLLTEAKDAGIIEFKLHNPMSNNRELAELFIKKFNLRRCFVIPTTLQQTDLLIRLVAERAIEFFNEELNTNDTIGIAWGRTCYEFMSLYYNDQRNYDINIVPLIGASDNSQQHCQLNEMVRTFAEKISGEPHFLHAPVLADTEEEKTQYLSSAMMKKISNLWAQLDVAIISIGLPTSNESDNTHYLGREFHDAPEFSNAVGDLCGWPIDENGQFLDGPGSRRLLACPMDKLRDAEKVFGIVAGIEKSFAIRAGLRSGIFDYMVIDEQTARAVLDIME